MKEEKDDNVDDVEEEAEEEEIGDYQRLIQLGHQAIGWEKRSLM